MIRCAVFATDWALFGRWIPCSVNARTPTFTLSTAAAAVCRKLSLKSSTCDGLLRSKHRGKNDGGKTLSWPPQQVVFRSVRHSPACYDKTTQRHQNRVGEKENVFRRYLRAYFEVRVQKCVISWELRVARTLCVLAEHRQGYPGGICASSETPLDQLITNCCSELHSRHTRPRVSPTHTGSAASPHNEHE